MSFPLNEPVLYPLSELKHGPVLVSASVQARSAEACIKKKGGEIRAGLMCFYYLSIHPSTVVDVVHQN